MKKKILVCDDEESIRLLLAEALQDIYEITEAADGHEAVKHVTKDPPDLVIMDIKMAGTHGLEAIERIRERNNEIPIIVCSAYRLMQDDMVVKTSDIAAFITKPVDINDLRKKIATILGM